MHVNVSAGEVRHSPAVQSGVNPPDIIHRDDLDKSSVAELRAATLDLMTGTELVRVIYAAGLPGILDSDSRQLLESYDRMMLLRLAHIARRCCRHQGY